ncbi:MAG: response regulator [Phycisphaerales bacterium]|nr:MAG: response regulator [Phycisphaerales bacterium]
MSAVNSARSLIDILLIEDNPGDVRLIREVLQEGKILNQVTVLDDGEMAIQHFEALGADSNSNWPHLILLDLNLPKINGTEVLEWLKDHARFKRIPVIILTSSKSEEDVVRSYNLHANCFITKPVGLEQFMSVVRSIEHFWLTIVHLPTD